MDANTLLELGPDRTSDFTTSRSFFLVPLLELGESQNLDSLTERISQYGKEHSVTDVYVFSHGWHRNLFSGVAAYDRLVSRFVSLMERGVLVHPDKQYSPLFIALHWNSDPDADGWVDVEGRRHKESFIANMMALFEPRQSKSYADRSEHAAKADAEATNSGKSDSSGPARLLDITEEIYALFTHVSAPGFGLAEKKAANSANLMTRFDECAQVRNCLSDTPGIAVPDKSSIAWRCYVEADAMQLLYGQNEKPRPYQNPLQAIKNWSKFLITAVGVWTIIALMWKTVTSPSASMRLSPEIHTVVVGITSHPVFGSIVSSISRIVKVSVEDATSIFLAFSIGIIALLVLWVTATWHQLRHQHSGGRGIPLVAVLAWLPAQLITALPLITYTFATSIFRTPLVLLAPIVWRYHSGHAAVLVLILCTCYSIAMSALNIELPLGFDERYKIKPTIFDVISIRRVLALFARLPVRLLKNSVSDASRVFGVALAVDRQLAFYHMQHKAVSAGNQAGTWLVQLQRALNANRPTNECPRVHLIGHSFGALVVTSIARKMAALRTVARASNDNEAENVNSSIHSLTLLQGAIASGWFRKEKWSMDKGFVHAVIANVYSRYDTANSFFYPNANSSRGSMGYFGAYGGNETIEQFLTISDKGALATLVRPIDLVASVGNGSTTTKPYRINIDASRFIYNGNALLGGGHDDIFKDDVVNLLWSITTVGVDTPAARARDTIAGSSPDPS